MELTTLVHGAEEAEKARKTAASLFGGGGDDSRRAGDEKPRIAQDAKREEDDFDDEDPRRFGSGHRCGLRHHVSAPLAAVWRRGGAAMSQTAPVAISTDLTVPIDCNCS